MAGESQGYGSETRPPNARDDGAKLIGNDQRDNHLIGAKLVLQPQKSSGFLLG